MAHEDTMAAFRKAAAPFKRIGAKKPGAKSRVGQGKGRDGDGDGIRNEAGQKKVGGLNKGPAKTWVLGKGRPLPSSLHGVPFKPWDDVPASPEDWADVIGQNPSIKEPPLPKLEPNQRMGSGVIIREPDGRVWITRPTNGFGGYKHTFPKGGLEEGLSPQANAIKEAFEETGLQVRITGFARDVKRSTSQARYYFAERTGGTPLAHGWESEAVVLAPPESLPKLLNAYVDQDLAHTTVGAPKPPRPAEGGVWAGLNPAAAPLGAKSGKGPPAGFGAGLTAPQYGIGKVPAKTKGAEPGAKPFSIGQGASKPKKATSFSGMLDWLKPGGKVQKAAKLPKKLKVGTKTGLPPGHPKGKAPKDMDADGKVFDGTPYEQPASTFKKPAAPSAPSAPPPAAAPKVKKPAAEIHGQGPAMAKWSETNGAANAAKKAIGTYEKLHAAGDLANLKAALKDYDALLPGKGNAYTKAKALAHKALVADLESQVADAIVATAPKSFAIRLPKPKAAGPLTKPAAQAAPAMSGPVIPKTVGWKEVGGQLGSNPGVQATNAAGQKFYVKFAKSPAHAANEVTGAHLYDLAGHSTLKPGLIDATPLGGQPVSTATAWQTTTKFNPANPAHMKAAHADFATHAWLGNWDAIGASYDNLAFAGGKAVMVDTGGTMIFRAQGTPKGADWGADAVEWDTLRNAATPGNAPKVFGSMTSQDLFESAQKVAAVPDESIIKVVMAHGPGDLAARQALADTLIARKQSIIAKANDLKLGSKIMPDGSVVSDAATITKPIVPAAPKPQAAAGGMSMREIDSILGKEPAFKALTADQLKNGFSDLPAGKLIAAAEAGDVNAISDLIIGLGPSPLKSVGTKLKAAIEAKAPKPAAATAAKGGLANSDIEAALADASLGGSPRQWATYNGSPNISGAVKAAQAGDVAALDAIIANVKPKGSAGLLAASLKAKLVAAKPVAGTPLKNQEINDILSVTPSYGNFTHKVADQFPDSTLAAAINAVKAGNVKALDDILASPDLTPNSPVKQFIQTAKQQMGAAAAAGANVRAATGAAKLSPKAAPEALPTIKTPPTLPAQLPANALSSPANPNKGLLANHQKVADIATDYAKGAIPAQQALDELSAIKFGSNSFGQKAAKHQAATMAAIGSHGGVTQAAAKAGSAIPAPPALAIPKPKPSTPKGPKTWDAATDAKKVSEPPNFMQWGGTGKPGPSSVQGINQANFDATQAIYALAKKGDVDGIKALKVPVFNKDTNSLGAEVLALNHPSQHVKGYAEQALAEIDSILNPTKAIRVRDVEDLVDLASKHPAIPIADVSKVERIGYYAVVGKVPAASAEEIGAALYKPGIQKTTANKKLTSQTYQAQAATAWKAMSSTQKSAIKSHTGSGYGYMNDALWKGNETAAAAAVRSGIVTHGHYIEPGTVLRRNIDLDQQTRDKLLNAVGHTLMEPANMSTSLAGAFGNSRNTRLNITVGPNVKGLFVSANVPGEGVISAVGSGEAEMLIPSGARMFVRGTKIENGRLVVDVLLLPNDTL